MRTCAVKDTSSTLITLMFPLDVPPEHAEGPPWPLSLEVYHELLDDAWDLVHLVDIDTTAGQGRHTGPRGDEKLGIWKWKG